MTTPTRQSDFRLYSLAPFRETRRRVLFAHAASHPFASVVTHGADGLLASELPILVEADANGEGGVLRGHVARNNAQFEHFSAGADALVVFHGPHGYVSPSVYEGKRGVPTWNYVVVQARGPSRGLDAQGTVDVLAALTERFDDTGWRPTYGEEWPDVPKPMLEAIAGFEIRVDAIEGKWKLSQNRTPEDQARVADWLARGDAASQATAALMRERL